jgi:hypothetical protein
MIYYQNIIFKWFFWYLFEVPREILKGWRNFLRFGFNFFSVPLLIKTFFSPWHRYRWAYPKGFDFWQYLEVFFSNIISRVLGAILRFPLIIVGVLLEVFLVFFGLLVFLGWFLLPLFLILGLYHGFRIFLF